MSKKPTPFKGLTRSRYILLLITGRTPREWYNNNGYLRPGWEWAPNGDFQTISITCRHAPNIITRTLAHLLTGSKYRPLVLINATNEISQSGV